MGIAVAMASLFLLSGCQKTDAPPTRPTPRQTVEYTGQDLQGEVYNLKGTPLYSRSQDLAQRVKVEGAPFLLLASKEPLQALLVVVTDTTPEELVGRKSELKDFSGNAQGMDIPGLVEHVKEVYELDLKTDPSGKVLVLKISSPPPAAAPTPAATESGENK